MSTIKEEPRVQVEGKVADVLLETPAVVSLGGQEYRISPPSIATLVLAGKYIAKIPAFKMDEQRPLASLLGSMEGMQVVGRVLAVLMLGAQLPRENKGFWHRFRAKKQDPYHDVSQKILHSPVGEVERILREIWQMMHLEHFFAITTFLQEMSITKPTKVVD